MSFLKKLFKGKPKPVPEPVGKWIENVQHFNYGGGMMGNVPTGTWHWEGPEPANGVRPQNPGETPEAIERRKMKAAQNAANKERSNAAYKRAIKQVEEAAEENKACKNAIAAVKAKRSNVATRRRSRKARKTRKN
jgi:hypothetical protein